MSWKVSPRWCRDLSHQRGSRKRTQVRKIMICGDGPSKAILCGARPSTNPPSPLRKQTKRTFGYFLFRLRCCANPRCRWGWCIASPVPFINTDNYTFCEPPLTVALVNIFSGNRAAVVAAALPHSPGPPEMNPCMSGLSLCICADGKHDRVRFSTSLNKSLECFNTQRE